MLNLIPTNINDNTIYSQLQVVGKLSQTSGDNINTIVGSVIGSFFILVVVMALWIYCKNRKQKLNLRKEEQNAVRQNELNAVNAINKTKMLDDYKIVNALGEFESDVKDYRLLNMQCPTSCCYHLLAEKVTPLRNGRQ